MQSQLERCRRSRAWWRRRRALAATFCCAYPATMEVGQTTSRSLARGQIPPAHALRQGQWHRRPSCWLHPGGAATTGRGRPGAPLRLSPAGCGSDMLRSDLSAARQPEISDPHSVCRLNHRFARDGLQGGCSKAGQPAS